MNDSFYIDTLAENSHLEGKLKLLKEREHVSKPSQTRGSRKILWSVFNKIYNFILRCEGDAVETQEMERPACEPDPKLCKLCEPDKQGNQPQQQQQQQQQQYQQEEQTEESNYSSNEVIGAEEGEEEGVKNYF